VSDASRSQQAAAVQPLHAITKMFVAFCIVMALLGFLSFWPPRSPAIVAWLLVWTITCLGTGIAIVRRARYAPGLVWSLIILASYSAVSAFRSGLIGGVGVFIDILVGLPLIWFAIWYQRRRSSNSQRS
jgi:hypothetical protein